ncbi:MAG TPA: enoyl-CoA hydratase/isomerase family protein, partial [Chloroflexota bacterium]
LEEALDLLAGNDWQALVIGNQGDYFSAGVNLAELAALSRVGDGSSLETFLVRVQRLVQRVRFSLKPVVAAPFGQTLGLGLELCLACAGVCAEGDSAMGLVEVGVGLIPAGGGCKELVRRLVSPRASQLEELDSLPALRRVLWQVMQTKVSGSAAEARKLGYLTDHDRIILGQDQLLAAAKRMALDLAAGYRPPDSSRTCYAAGKLPLAALGSEIDQARSQGELTEHEATIASTLSWVLCGGDRSEAGWTEESALLALERQGFARLLAEEKTQLRIAHLLRTRERLRN